MRAKGYEIKGESFEEDAAKYISFRPLDKEHFVRGSTKLLGKEYTKERIRERIKMKRARKSVIPKKTTLPADSLIARMKIPKQSRTPAMGSYRKFEDCCTKL